MGSFYDDPIFFVPFYLIYADLFPYIGHLKLWVGQDPDVQIPAAFVIFEKSCGLIHGWVGSRI